MEKITKVVTVSALFPELRGGRCRQQGRGTGSTLAAAMGSAVRNLVKQPGLKAQRYSTFTATFSVGTITAECLSWGPEETPQ